MVLQHTCLLCASNELLSGCEYLPSVSFESWLLSTLSNASAIIVRLALPTINSILSRCFGRNKRRRADTKIGMIWRGLRGFTSKSDESSHKLPWSVRWYMTPVQRYLAGDVVITSIEEYVGVCDVENCGLFMRIPPGYMAHQGVMMVTGDMLPWYTAWLFALKERYVVDNQVVDTWEEGERERHVGLNLD